MATELRRPEILWDSNSTKILVYILEAKGLRPTSKDGSANAVCKISVGSSSFKTKQVKKSINPVFEEFFLMEASENGVSLHIEISDFKQKQFLGQIVVSNVTGMEQEKVHCFTSHLCEKDNKKSTVRGEICFRILVSRTTEKRPTSSSHRQKNKFFYEHFQNEFRTGDLILFSGYGVLDSAVKLRENSPFSRAGMLVKLTNPYTEKIVYLLEVTRNVDGFLDAFREDNSSGVNLFRFEERIHQFHGTAIYWARLKDNMNARALTDVKRFILSHHKGTNLRNISTYLTASHREIITWLSETFKIGRSAAEVIDFFSCHFLLKALSTARLCDDVQLDDLTVSKLVYLPCYSKPVPLRLLDHVPTPPKLEELLQKKKEGSVSETAQNSGKKVGAQQGGDEIPSFYLFHKYVAELAQTQIAAFGGCEELLRSSNEESEWSSSQSFQLKGAKPKFQLGERRSSNLSTIVQTGTEGGPGVTVTGPSALGETMTSSPSGGPGGAGKHRLRVGACGSTGTLPSSSASSSSSTTPPSSAAPSSSTTFPSTSTSSPQLGNPASPRGLRPPSPSSFMMGQAFQLSNSKGAELVLPEGREKLMEIEPSFHDMELDELSMLEKSVLAEVDSMLSDLQLNFE